MKFYKSALIATVSAAISVPAIAEQDQIIVTASRTAQTVDDSLASVTIITQKDIEQQQANNLLELLNALSGIDMVNNGGVGKATSMFIRGTSSKHVLVMIDGIKIGSATNGSIAFQHIPVSQIERIEIVRGPRASLYGSEAVGGVIQIFTKKGAGKESGSIDMQYGSFVTNRITASINGGSEKTRYSLTANSLKTAGFDAKNDSETDDDGYQNNSFSFNLSHKISDTSSLEFNSMRANGNTQYDGYYNSTDFLQQVTGLRYIASPSSSWKSTLEISESLDKTYNTGSGTSQYDTTRTTYSWQNDITLAENQLLTVGADYQNDTVESTTNYDETSRNNIAAFIQHQWSGENNDLQLALRNDQNQAFGNHSTGNIAWGHNFSTTTRIIASYGTAFKTPTFNDLYWPSAGDPNLKPESSSTAELELRKQHSWGKASISLYDTQIENLISGWPPKNVDRARIKGVELRLNTVIAGWNTRLQYSLLDPRDTKTGKLLARRSSGSYRLDMDKSSGKWTAGLSIIGQGFRYDDTANTTRLDGYNLVNLRASYALSKKMKLSWKIENLFDTKYTLVDKYNTPGLSGYISLSYQGF